MLTRVMEIITDDGCGRTRDADMATGSSSDLDVIKAAQTSLINMALVAA